LASPIYAEKISSGPFKFFEATTKMKKKFKVDKHILIPKHVKLGEKEREKLLEKYNISLKELPRISKADPAIENLDAKPGDVIKVIRQSPTAGEAAFYRVVTNV